NGTLSNFALSGSSSNFVNSPLQGILNLTLNINSCGPYLAPNGQSYSTSGFYSDTIRPQAGCDTIMDLNLTVTNLDSSASRVAANQLEANESDTAAQFQWLNCANGYAKINGAVGKQFTFVQNGSYAVEVRLNNCIDTSACIVISNVGLTENFSSFSLYPNPALGSVKIEAQPGQFEHYSLMDLSGSVLIKGRLNLNGKTDLDLSKVKTGLYLIRLRGKQVQATQKLQIDR
ncbi:unnamed protein product, partial [Laminaria digitata]